MTDQEWKEGTSIWAVKALIERQAEDLCEMVSCPKKSELERIHHKLRRELESFEQASFEQALRDSDKVAEHKALYRIASTITRYYRILKTDGLG